MNTQHNKNIILTFKKTINASFQPNGILVTLTYSPEKVPNSTEESSKQVTKFVRAAREYFRHKNIKFGYAYITALNNRGYPHHEIIMPEAPIEIIKEMWGNGFVFSRKIDKNSLDVARYMYSQIENSKIHMSR